jgi:putative hydrolase of the HAD superfamily
VSRLPQAILLDLDDTIIDDSGPIPGCWEGACAGACTEFEGIDVEEVYRAIERTRAWFWSDPERHRRGRLDLEGASEEVAARSLEAIGAPNPVLAGRIAARYRERRETAWQPLPFALETVRWFRESGCRLALVTNGGAATQQRKIARFGLADLFDAILIEGELGYGKPEPRIYEQALAALAAKPANAWMIGDHLEWDVAQPQELGLRAIWIDVRGRGLPSAAPVRPYRVVRQLSDLRNQI